MPKRILTPEEITRLMMGESSGSRHKDPSPPPSPDPKEAPPSAKDGDGPPDESERT